MVRDNTNSNIENNDINSYLKKTIDARNSKFKSYGYFTSCVL
jgi:hypothetical protein